MAYNRLKMRYVAGWSLATAAALLLSFQLFFGLWIAGFLVGFAQWAVSRRQIPIRVWWILVTGAGWVAGLWLAAWVEGSSLAAGGSATPLKGFYLGAIAGVPLGALQTWRLGRWGFSRFRILQLAGAVLGTGAFFALLAFFFFDGLAPDLPFGFADAGETPAGYGLRYDAVVALSGLLFGLITALTVKVAVDHPGGEEPARFRGFKAGIWRWIPEVLALLAIFYLCVAAVFVPRTGRAPPPEGVRLNIGEYTSEVMEDSGGWILHRYDLQNVDGRAYNGYLFHGPEAPRRVPLVVFLGGSGSQSVLGFCERKLVPQLLKRRFWLASLDKVGVGPSKGESPDPGGEFGKYDYKEERVRNASQLIDVVWKEHGRFAGLYVIGYSEGVDVAARLARSRSDVRALVMMGGGGYAQADEVRVGLHERMDIPGAFFDRVQARMIDRHVWRTTMYVLADASPDKNLMGLSYRRWSSYIASAPADDLLHAEFGRALSVHGGCDRRSPIRSARHMQEMLRVGGKHTLREYRDLDHDFRDEHGTDHLAEVLEDAFAWLFPPVEQG